VAIERVVYVRRGHAELLKLKKRATISESAGSIRVAVSGRSERRSARRNPDKEKGRRERGTVLTDRLSRGLRARVE